MTEQQASLQELMALDFKLYDLQLYLNTHPFDGEILELYQDLSKEAQTAKTKRRDSKQTHSQDLLFRRLCLLRDKRSSSSFLRLR